jgi:hypothetical protein
MAAELLKRQFLSEIQPRLFPSYGYLSRAISDDAFVNNNTVELPHSGTIPAVAVDRSSLPATIAKRTDAATNYQLEELTTDPTLLQDSESLTVAYDKRASILDQHAKQQMEKCGARALYKWAAGAASYVPTTGSARAATGASQTGNRNAITLADLLAIKRRFHADDVIPDNSNINGIAVITPSMYNDILGISQLTDAEKFGTPGLPQGVISRILGFDIYIRSSVLVTNNSDALKAEGAAAAATDQDAAIFYSPDYVRRAKGAVKVYVDNDKPEYYGSVFSTMVRFGAAPARNDNKGVYLLFENTV